MAMPMDAKDVAVGDWSPNYGTVVEVKATVYQGKVTSIFFQFFNGATLTVAPDYQIVIEQDGANIIHNGMPDASEIRPGLKADHAKD